MTQGGGLLQLVATGKQDVFLTGNPRTSYFKFVYNRHTNFAVESQQLYFDGTPNFGQKISCLVPRAGDLLGPMFLRVTLPQLYLTTQSNPTPSKVGYCNSPGHVLIQEISIQIGEQEIDKQTGQWLEIWSALSTDASQREGLQAMLQQRPGYPFLDYANNAPDVSGSNPTLPKHIYSRENGNSLVDISGVTVAGGHIQPSTRYPRNYDDPIMGPVTLYIPLRFWFNKNPGSYLPLLAMQYHPIRINITLAPLQMMYYTKQLYLQEATPSLCGSQSVQAAQSSPLDIQLWGDYVFLDIPERRRFVSTPLEYLIEQVQYTPPLAIPYNSRNATLRIDFNHPIKEFIWVLQRNVMQSRHEYFNWSSLGNYEIEMANTNGFPEPPNRTDLMTSAVLQLDGQDRFDTRDPAYFRLVQPYQHHTTTPVDRYIYCYSFAFKPEELRPSGSLNASRIDTIILQLGMQSPTTSFNTSVAFGDMSAYVYGLNYNILRVVDGYAGLLFSV
jgi:hypothetical protein